MLTEEHLKTTFRLFTKDENRNISPQEFKLLLGLQTKFSDKTWEQIIKAIDINGDNQVNKITDFRLNTMNLKI